VVLLITLIIFIWFFACTNSYNYNNIRNTRKKYEKFVSPNKVFKKNIFCLDDMFVSKSYTIYIYIYIYKKRKRENPKIFVRSLRL